MEEDKELNIQTYNVSKINEQSSNARQPKQLPPTQIQLMKRELIYIFWFESLGTFILTFAVYASNNNAFVIAGMYGILLMLAQNQKCTFNPAITFILGLTDKATWITVAIFSQFFGAIIGGLVGFLFFSNHIENAAYLETSLSTSLIADCFGEILGSAILTVGIIFQYDELLDFTNNRLEHSIIIGSLYAFGRTLAYKSQSILNPAVALSLEFFESCKDDRWGRFEFVWIFLAGPLVGAILAAIFISKVYKPAFERQIKVGLRV